MGFGFGGVVDTAAMVAVMAMAVVTVVTHLY